MIKYGGALLGLVLLASCSTPVDRGQRSVVRQLDLGSTPRMHAIAERARKTADATYPNICALLEDGKVDFPDHFDICFEPELANGNLAVTRLSRICVNAQYVQEFEGQPEVFDEMLVHEMAHVAQHYYRKILGRWLVADPRPPTYWAEGIADYVCFKLGITNGMHCAECNSVFPAYTDGYSCAGAFLLYLERTYHPRIVAQLNTALRRGRYSDEFFFQTTGKDLPMLWMEFRRTEAFTPAAARMLRLQETLGFVEGKAPKDINLRLKTYLDEHADEHTKQMLSAAHVPALEQGGIQTRLTTIYYFTQPGGSAEAYITNLQEKQQLPGFSKGEHGMFSSFLGGRELNVAFPMTRLFIASKEGETLTYHYTVYRGSQDTAWRLQRAWRTNKEGTMLEEYPVR